MMGRAPLFLSLLLHALVVVGLTQLHPSEASGLAADLVSFIVAAPPPAAEPLPPPPPPMIHAAPSPAPVIHHAPRASKPAAAAGPRPEQPPAPDTRAAPLPAAAPDDPAPVELPSGDGTGAGGTAEAGNGDPSGGAGDGHGGGDGGRPPIPLGDARHARVPYTREAIEAHVGGVVLIDLFVDEHGDVADARLRQGIGYGLDPLALARARTFRFEPARDHRGKAVAQWIVWEFHFEKAD